MRGRGEDVALEPKPGELSQVELLLFRVCLVEHQQHGHAALVQLFRYGFVDGCQVVSAVAHEHDAVRRVERNVRLARHLGAESVVQRGADAARVHRQRIVVRDADGGAEAVAGDAGLVMNNGNAAADHAVEDGGFADIGSADDGDGGTTHGDLQFTIDD